VKLNDQHINNINSDLKKKCTFDALDELKTFLLNELDDLKDQMDQKLELKADKDWVAKMLKKLHELIGKDKGVESEDAMFSRKPLLNQ